MTSNKTGVVRNHNIPPNVSMYDTPLHIASVTDEQPQTYSETWTKKIEALLTILFHNCKYLSKYHNYRYHKGRVRLKLFRIPIIILSAVNAYTAIGLQPYTLQTNISTINSVISLICGIITSVELFLNIQKKMEKELQSHIDFNVLSVEIMKMLLLDVNKRNQDGRVFLDDKFSCFLKFTENGNAMNPNYFVDVFDITDMEQMNQKIKNMVHKEIKNDKALVNSPITPDIQHNYNQVDESHFFDLPQFLTFKGIKKMYDPQLYDLKEEKKQCSSHVRSMSNAMSPVKNVHNLKRNHSIELMNTIQKETSDNSSEEEEKGGDAITNFPFSDTDPDPKDIASNIKEEDNDEEDTQTNSLWYYLPFFTKT